MQKLTECGECLDVNRKELDTCPPRPIPDPGYDPKQNKCVIPTKAKYDSCVIAVAYAKLSS